MANNTKESLLNDSPDNVHYFFLSSRFTESDVEGMANVFNEIIQEMSPEMQDHWNNHLHFCPVRVPNP